MGSNSLNITKCAACQYGNQEINSECVTRKSKDKEVEVLVERNNMEPGKLIFSDQYK